jgi:NAD(P)-dependent dehydrogenase (short-subunit alcohol dehydrogenase family)
MQLNLDASKQKSEDVPCRDYSTASTFNLPPESRGEAPGRGRMIGRRVLVVGAGQTDYHLEDQPIGNGRAISLLLAREGAKVAASDHDQSAVDGTVELITAGGGEATAMIADVRNPSDVVEMVERARDCLGGLDGVVYNVGITGPEGIQETTPEAWDNTFNVNLRGAMLTARAALPGMEPGSAFVFISSIGAFTPRLDGRLISYAASKLGMTALMRDVAFLGKERSIRANIVMPGSIDTGIERHHGRLHAPAEQGPAPIFQGMLMGRHGTAWETAYLTLFLLSQESAYITGQVVAIDGGLTTL